MSNSAHDDSYVNASMNATLSVSEVQHCGFVAIVGRPNVGKSTLLNHLVGQKISITSRKPQTTQHKINGILTKSNYQYVFVDTPGFQLKHVNRFNRLLNLSVINALSYVNVVLFVVEAPIFTMSDRQVLALIPKHVPTILVINKKDKVKQPLVLNEFVRAVTDFRASAQTEDANNGATTVFANQIFTCAKHGAGIDDLISSLQQYIPAGEFLYSDSQLTDKSNNFLASEIIREKLFRHLGAELPYNLTVVIEGFEHDKDNQLIKVMALIIVNKASHKGIVIGKDGEHLKKISTEARIDMEQLFNSKVFLQLWVKVRAGFAAKDEFLNQFK